MSERKDQNQQVDSGSHDSGNRSDPLAELARIVAGENPIEVTAPRLMADTNRPIAGMEAETQVDFSIDPVPGILPESAPSSAPIAVSGQVPLGASSQNSNLAPQVRVDEIPGGDDFNLEASLENQLMQEFEVPGIVDAPPSGPAANLTEAGIQGLQEVETLAEEFVSETAIGKTASNHTTISETVDVEPVAAPAPYDKYAVSQEFTREAVPSHLLPADSPDAFAEAPSIEPIGDVIAPAAGSYVAGEISADLGDDFDAKFDEIAQQAAAVDDLHFTAESSDGDLNLEAEFESAFASELDQNDILPEATTAYVAPPIGEFGTPYPDSGDLDAPAGPEHLSDPSMFDDTAASGRIDDAAMEKPRRSGFKMAALALGIALLIGFAAVGYGFFSRDGGDGAPIVVMADPGEIKIKPKDRGGVVIANQDKASYAEISGKTEERIQDRLFSGTETANEPPKVSALEPKFEERLAPGFGEQAEKLVAIAPRKVRTFTVRPDGTIITPEPAPLATGISLSEPQTRSLGVLQSLDIQSGAPVVDVAANDPVIVAPRRVETVRVEPPIAFEAAPPIMAEPQEIAVVEKPEPPIEIIDIAPGPIDGAAVASGDIAVPQQSPLPKPVRVTPQASTRSIAEATISNSNNATVQLANAPAPAASIQPSASNSAWAIQISSQRSRAAADASYQNLLRRFPSLLNGRSFDILEAQVSGKGTFFRVRIQADSKQGASRFCTQFKSSGGSCFITR